MSEKLKLADDNLEKLTIPNYNDFADNQECKYPTVGQLAYEFGSWTSAKKGVLGKGDRRKVNIYSLNYIIENIKKAKEHIEEITYDNVKKWCDNNGIKFPSLNYIRKHHIKWGRVKAEVVDYKTLPHFCENCGIGRCRFDYNIDNCEYYEGE